MNISRGHLCYWIRYRQACPLRSSWGVQVCLIWRDGGWGVTSVLSTASWGDADRQILLSSPWYPVPGHMENSWNLHLSWGVQTWWEETFLYQEGVKLWNRPLGEVVDACLSVLKRHLDSALKNILYFFISPEVLTQLDYETDVGPFQLKYVSCFSPYQYMLRKSLITFFLSPALAEGTEYPHLPSLAQSSWRKEAQTFWGHERGRSSWDNLIICTNLQKASVTWFLKVFWVHPATMGLNRMAKPHISNISKAQCLSPLSHAVHTPQLNSCKSFGGEQYLFNSLCVFLSNIKRVWEEQ